MKVRVRYVVLAAVLLTMAACASVKHREVPPAPAAHPPAAQVEGTHYRVVPEQSEVHILVYRGGPLARLGHNHVMVSRDVAGDIWIADSIERSSLTVNMPVETLIVDDAEARRSEGADFPVEVPEDAKQGTRKNMLSAAVLDGDQFKTIELRSTAISGTRTALRLTLAITIKDQTREVEVPASVSYEQDRWVATGEFAIKQSDFGIQPFSVAMGAVQVVDELRIKFKVSGVREE